MTGATAIFVAEADVPVAGEASSVEGDDDPAEPRRLLPVSHPARLRLEIIIMPTNATDFTYRRAAAAA